MAKDEKTIWHLRATDLLKQAESFNAGMLELISRDAEGKVIAAVIVLTGPHTQKSLDELEAHYDALEGMEE